MYIQRHIEAVIKKATKQTKAVLVTGARQVGKSTSVQKVFPEYPYVTLDDENELNMALHDRALFFKDKAFPLIVDEVQYAKDLLRTVKMTVDRDRKKGQIIITGSQTYELLSATAESLAGRVSILEMSGLSMRETSQVTFADAFIPSDSYLKKRKESLVSYGHIWERIFRGSMPELTDESRDRAWFYRDYIRTYIERDVRKIVNVQDEMKFRNLLVSLAARSGQILIYDDVASDVGIDIKTAQRWISVIEGSGLIKIIRPYQNNAIKRAVKSPKLYFMDTGLLCYIVGWDSAETAENGAMSGQIFETFVISEIVKSFLNSGRDIQDSIYYYRDKDKKEIDLIIADGRTLYPVEIKKNATVQSSWANPFSVLEKISDREIAPATIVCRTENVIPLGKNARAIPVEYI